MSYHLRFSPWHIRRDTWALFCANMLPDWLIYWAAIRLISYATTGKYSSTIVPELSAMDALQRWSDKLQNLPGGQIKKGTE